MPDITTILSDLIQIRTDNPLRPNTDIVNYICNILTDNNVIFRRVLNPDGISENIIAGINIKQLADIDNALVLSGHMDTVGTTESEWICNPYSGQTIDGKLYGRGAVDMKFFIATVLSILPQIQESGTPTILLFSADEETNVNGIRTLIKFMSDNNIHPKYALVGESTHFNICTGNRGYAGYTTQIHGRAAHSSAPGNGINAAYIAAKFITNLESLGAQYTDANITMNVGTVNGGTGRNMIPSHISIDWEIRYSRNDPQTEILNKINDYTNTLCNTYSGANITTVAQEVLPPFEDRPNNTLANIASDILHTKTFTMPIATEAGFLQSYGIETLICGAGDDTLAHTSNEHIYVSDLYKYQDFLIKLINRI